MSDDGHRVFASFDALLAFIRDWRMWADAAPHEYDVNGMLCLLGACADNLRRFALAAELADGVHVLTAEQAEFLGQYGRVLEGVAGRDEP